MKLLASFPAAFIPLSRFAAIRRRRFRAAWLGTLGAPISLRSPSSSASRSRHQGLDAGWGQAAGPKEGSLAPPHRRIEDRHHLFDRPAAGLERFHVCLDLEQGFRQRRGGQQRNVISAPLRCPVDLLETPRCDGEANPRSRLLRASQRHLPVLDRRLQPIEDVTRQRILGCHHSATPDAGGDGEGRGKGRGEPETDFVRQEALNPAHGFGSPPFPVNRLDEGIAGLELSRRVRGHRPRAHRQGQGHRQQRSQIVPFGGVRRQTLFQCLTARTDIGEALVDEVYAGSHHRFPSASTRRRSACNARC